METNELPEAIKKQIDEEADTYSTATVWISRHPYSNSTPAGHEFNEYISGKSYKDGAEFGYRLALQSKEEEVKQLNEEIVKRNWGILEAGALKMTIESLEEQLKAKDEMMADREQEIKELFELCNSYKAQIDSLTKEVKDWMGERIELLKQINSLTSEVERLRGLVERCRPLAFNATLDPKQNWNNQATELLQEIDLLSQSTDKQK